MAKTKIFIKSPGDEKVGLDWLLESTSAMDPFIDPELYRDTSEGYPVNKNKNDLEDDLMASEYMLQRVCDDVAYAQNLYAALCNTEWCKKDVVSILKEEYWSCSWRAAGGIVADMRQTGDYIDWYCSGISVFVDMDDATFDSLTPSQLEMYHIVKRYVQEGFITDEVRRDLLELGWIPVDYNPNI